ncbi:activating signal cointegrator 1 complex subunit 3-like [Amphibalanus amphitrite]|uniref:activating signal cointegrator 1 complex subunit 3-like n=1 Tax=Amphibalanus amphitrite TaxID=1232801 RepID=UPI001C92B775|nr:activating signal cointegrator 1 complex subunit 3-like [Amphibalanus amphitrite]
MAPTQGQPPRLSAALRQFTDVCPRRAAPPPEGAAAAESVLARRLRQKAEQQKRCAGEQWHRLQQAAGPNCRRQLKQLQLAALAALGGDAPPPAVEEAAVTAVRLLAGAERLTAPLRHQLEAALPAVTAAVGQQLLQAVQDAVTEMEPAALTAALSPPQPADDGQEAEFGASLRLGGLEPCEWQEPTLSDLGGRPNGTAGADSSFNMLYRSDAAPEKKSLPYGPDWLAAELSRAAGPSDALDDLSLGVYNLLESNSDNDALQSELLDLLGFERIELVSTLLSRRSEVLEARSAGASQRSVSPRTFQKLSALVNGQRPANLPGQSITVQSQREVEARKALRREEKRMQRERGRQTATGQDSEAPAIQPELARAQREMELLQAMSAPLFPDRPRAAPSLAERLPYVFDAYSQARQTSAFVAGNKISLPVGCEWSDHKLYQAVEIPVAEQAPTGVGDERVQISTLDQIGQKAFGGIKQLNRIQSVVFKTAYETNENLLICAPTGAGKTNIAMLTVVHQIRQHIDKGVIQRDAFKIVYVAPMKALAAEMTAGFGRRLAPLGITVRECTGDMQLTKQEIMQTQMLVTTPEKWDVLTRKSTGDVSLTQLVKLLIIDEVHLLHGDRGPVVEALVARTLRQVESSQSMIRIVGLSATLPNYIDVAEFLRVNPRRGLFFFDGRFRPVPLGQCFIGVKALNAMQQMNDMDTVCYEKAFDMVSKGHQVMVFVHARNATVRVATRLREIAKQRGQLGPFRAEQSPQLGAEQKNVQKSKNRQLRELFDDGFAMHHAGMLRQDRNLVERLFSQGMIRVLCCTATLAWGVNLPAHAVIIRGTDIYDAKHGSFVDLGVLDVMQIFGRAGRPQFDRSGHGTIITTQDKLSHYLSLLTNQYPIESSFTNLLADNLNAEVALGTVTNVEEAVQWLSYTYLYVRMRKNPQVYGIKPDELQDDTQLLIRRRQLIESEAAKLDKALMVRYDPRTTYLDVTDLGRIASHYYIKYDTVMVINERIQSSMYQRDILAMISQSSEFEQIKVRDDELDELDRHIHEDCEEPVLGGSENVHGKVNILIQTFISRGRIDSFSLVSDMNYIVQNAKRIVRAVFEICLHKHWPLVSAHVLQLSLQLERQQWASETPLRQCGGELNALILEKLDQRNLRPDDVREMDVKELGFLIRDQKKAPAIRRAASEIPAVTLDASVQPITRRVLRVRLTITPDFRWSDRVHGKTSETFIVWVEDPDSNYMYHHEYFILQKKQVLREEPQSLVFTIPIFEPLPAQYYIRVLSERWLGSEAVHPLSFKHLILPDRHPPHTDLLNLRPLPVSALQNIHYESLYGFTHFNPIQTQLFHALYHSDCNLLLGAPTGSGKTIVAEIAMFRVFTQMPKRKVVYIAPMKALVRERMNDWRERLQRKLGLRLVELTGDVTPDVRAIQSADVIVTTPEKWDGVSRSWQTRNYVQDVALIIIDEIHMLGEDRGPVLEVIVSRTNFISSHTQRQLRIIGLSTAMANAADLASWLNIKGVGLYNFRPTVRPVPLEIHIHGFPGKHYCPRMATMNRPTFKAIQTHSPEKPSLVFVSSRRQTRLTALDLIAYLAAEDNPKQWLHMDEAELQPKLDEVRDPNLRLTLAFGIGIHHAGLVEYDRKLVEKLFVEQKIQVLIATATLAWGVNFPAHLVVVKGTEYFDGKQKRYVDFPITDVLQMMGRAGRPQYDDNGVAVVLVHDQKKHFYKSFLYEPFPVESSLMNVLPDHLNAEIVAGTLQSKQDAIDYLTWTFFFRRVLQNPTYYDLESTDGDSVNRYLSEVVDGAVNTLEQSGCVEVDADNRGLYATVLGRIGSFYYLNHRTMELFSERLGADTSDHDLLKLVSDAYEYDEIPVRHNEDITNGELAAQCPVPVDKYSYDSPHVKTHLLFQAHFSRLRLPIADYVTDQKSVLDQAIRVCQALLDLVAESGWLATTIRAVQLQQQLIQARWVTDSPLLTLPHLESGQLRLLGRLDCLPRLVEAAGGGGDRKAFSAVQERLAQHMDGWQLQEMNDALRRLPRMRLSVAVEGWWEASASAERRPIACRQQPAQPTWLDLHADQEYTLQVELRRLNPPPKEGRALAHAPCFPKPKDEGWVLVLGEADSGELLALKRVGAGRGRCAAPLAFRTPAETGRHIYTLYLLSDSYLGLDQQYDLWLNVVEPSVSAQVNGELGDLE